MILLADFKEDQFQCNFNSICKNITWHKPKHCKVDSVMEAREWWNTNVILKWAPTARHYTCARTLRFLATLCTPEDSPRECTDRSFPTEPLAFGTGSLLNEPLVRHPELRVHNSSSPGWAYAPSGPPRQNESISPALARSQRAKLIESEQDDPTCGLLRCLSLDIVSKWCLFFTVAVSSSRNWISFCTCCHHHEDCKSMDSEASFRIHNYLANVTCSIQCTHLWRIEATIRILLEGRFLWEDW